MSTQLHVGLIVNPLAGIGGSLALKGSDGQAVRALVAARVPGHKVHATERTQRALAILAPHRDKFRFSCWSGDMGENALRMLELDTEVLGAGSPDLTCAQDTRLAATRLVDAGVDIIVFAGGDGTARDIFDVVGSRCPVLGIPAGVKMHSGVFAVSPEAAGDLVLLLADGDPVGLTAQEVRDIDEEAMRQDVVRSRFYGELLVPNEGHHLQHTKVGGREDPELAAADIAAWQVECMQAERTYLIGPGSTTAAIMEALQLPNTLLGVDVVRNGNLLAADATEQHLLTVLAEADNVATIIVTAIGGQGYIFGRGNQQLSARVIRAVGVDNIVVVAAKSKLSGLQGRPLLVDTNDLQLDLELCGYRGISTGYADQILYRVSNI